MKQLKNAMAMIRTEDDIAWSQFTHVISIDHCAGVTPLGVEYSDGEWIDGKFCNFELHATQETPHGDCYDEDFVAWWCEFPVELLTEPEENVRIGGWADG